MFLGDKEEKRDYYMLINIASYRVSTVPGLWTALWTGLWTEPWSYNYLKQLGL